MNDDGVWLFAYGSLIWRPDIPVLAEQQASAPGWSRRFWQGSHDHRGTPDSPGRVVTLIETPGVHCVGVAYQLDPGVLASTFDNLDHREKNGYERVGIDLITETGDALRAVTYLAPPDNFAWLGDAPLEELASHIAGSSGPSGSNPDYLFGLAGALRARAIDDEHVFGLEAAVRALICRDITHT